VLNVLNSIVKPFNDDNLMAIKPLKCIFALNYIIIIRMNNPVTGFSKYPKKKNKLDCQGILLNSFGSYPLLQNYWNSDEKYKSY
jgi:hypothetical protein